MQPRGEPTPIEARPGTKPDPRRSLERLHRVVNQVHDAEMPWAEQDAATIATALDELEALQAVAERAAMALRSFSEADDEAMTPDSVRAEARRTLRAMRKIGGFDV